MNNEWANAQQQQHNINKSIKLPKATTSIHAEYGKRLLQIGSMQKNRSIWVNVTCSRFDLIIIKLTCE
jgi:hypothetical protein